MNNFLGHLGMALVLVLILFGDAIVDWFDPGRIDKRVEFNAQQAADNCVDDAECLQMIDRLCEAYDASALSSKPSQQHWREYNATHVPQKTPLNIWTRICPDEQNWSSKYQECR